MISRENLNFQNLTCFSYLALYSELYDVTYASIGGGGHNYERRVAHTVRNMRRPQGGRGTGGNHGRTLWYRHGYRLSKGTVGNELLFGKVLCIVFSMHLL